MEGARRSGKCVEESRLDVIRGGVVGVGESCLVLCEGATRCGDGEIRTGC